MMDGAIARGARGELDEARAQKLPDLQVMLTAEEAFPYLEDMFLRARSRIVASFRIFDPETHLVSEPAREVGETWADLIVHTLARGVCFRLVLCDFDPVGAPDLHCTTHQSLRRMREAAAAAGVEHLLEATADLHAARSGLPARLAFAPMARRALAYTAERLDRQGESISRERLGDMPGLAALLRRDRHGRLQPRRFVLPDLAPCTHHQKIAAADGERLYIGGLDLNDRRWDGKSHNRAASRTWHDVQLGLTGPIAASAAAHVETFTEEVRCNQASPARPGLLRTLSTRQRGLGRLRIGPKPSVTEIYERTLSAISRAEELVYIETQFLRDKHVARALARRAREVPELGLIAVLPAAPEEVAFLDARNLGQRFGEHMQAKCLGVLARAFVGRSAFIAPAQPRGVAPDGSRAVLNGSPIVYIHAKVTIVDTQVALVSSANLNGRSHRWDTEAGLALGNVDQVAWLRSRLMGHWLPGDADAACLDPVSAPRAWHALASENAERQPNSRRGMLLPYPRTAPRRFGRPVPFLPSEMV